MENTTPFTCMYRFAEVLKVQRCFRRRNFKSTCLCKL